MRLLGTFLFLWPFALAILGILYLDLAIRVMIIVIGGLVGEKRGTYYLIISFLFAAAIMMSMSYGFYLTMY